MTTVTAECNKNILQNQGMQLKTRIWPSNATCFSKCPIPKLPNDLTVIEKLKDNNCKLPCIIT